MTSGFNIERLGILSVRWPRLMLGILVGLFLLSGYGITRVNFNSDLREIYRTDSAAFANLLEMTRQYSTGANDIYLVIEGGDLLGREVLKKLRALHLELRFIDGVRQVFSMFSARSPPAKDGRSRPIVPSTITETLNLVELRSKLMAHPFVGRNLLSQDGELALFIVAMTKQPASIAEFRNLVGRIEVAIKQTIGDTPLRATLTGSPVMRLEIIDALFRNQYAFMAIALFFGMVISWIVLRAFRLVVIACIPTMFAMTMVFGVMAAIGQDVNVLTNVVPVLVAVIALADSLHLLFGIRRHLEAGEPLETAIRRTIADIGPACVLTSITTAIALVSLLLVPHALINGFGAAAALGVVLAFGAAILGVPALSMVLLRNWTPPVAAASRLMRAANAMSTVAGRFVVRRPRSIAVFGVLALVGFGAMHLQNEPRYVYREYLPQKNTAQQALEKIDAELAGASSMRVVLQWRKGHDVFSPGSLKAITRVHQTLAKLDFVRQVWSLHRLAHWLESAGGARRDAIDRLKKMAGRLEGRLISSANGSALVTAQFVDRDASSLVPAIRQVEAELKKIEASTPGLRIYLTGISTIAATSVSEMITLLNRSLLISIILIVLLIGITGRSFKAALVSVVPNLLPILTAGAVLYSLGAGFQAASVVAFVIGFGMAVDSTIHILNYHRLASENGLGPVEAVQRTVARIGPVIMMCTAILIFGLGATIVGDMPTLRLFGFVSVLVLVVALIGDMLVLPATLMIMRQRYARR